MVSPPGIQKLDKEIQRKFARGVNYNMKVVIKGDARVGKTSLFLRLKGYGFVDDYVPTEDLNVTSIDWSYKNTDDVVKIDLWEDIDSSTKKIVDVFNNTHAVLFVMDMTKLWTFKYIQTELPKVPKHIPILIIANHRDQGHHRTVSPEQVTAFIDSLDRTPCDGMIMYTEASMKNGFGLRLIEKFFNIPFLKLQEASFLKQIELNRCEYMSTMEEIQLMQESINKEYEHYLELETIRRRQQADAMSPVNSGMRKLDEATREQIRNTTVSSEHIDKKNLKSLESNNNTEKSEAQVLASQKFVDDRLPSIVIGAKCPLPETKAIQLSKSQESQQLSNNNNNNNVENSDDSEDEEPRANPLVANYQSDLDSDDQ